MNTEPFTDREKKIARARFEKMDRLADKALRPSLGRFDVESPRLMKRLNRMLERQSLRRLLAIRDTAETHYKSQATWQLVQLRINAVVEAMDDPAELQALMHFCNSRAFNSHATWLCVRNRLAQLEK